MSDRQQLPRLAFLGAGNMAEAILRGLLMSGACPAERIVAGEVRPERASFIARELGISTFSSNVEALRQAEVAVISVKPQDVPVILNDLQRALDGQLVISIAAGVPTGTIEAALPPRTPVIRVMPNAAAFVGEAMTVIAPGRDAQPEHVEIATRIFEPIGKVIQLPESKLDAVTALSGSGPAFVALVIEALADGGVLAGLSREAALQLAAQTVLGTAKLVLERDQHPATIKDAVASPAGTTIAGLQVLEQRALRGALIDAVAKAADRSAELGREAHG